MSTTFEIPVPSRDAPVTTITPPYDVTNASGLFTGPSTYSTNPTTYASDATSYDTASNATSYVTFTNVTDPYGDYFPGGLKLHSHWFQYINEIENIPDAVYYGLGIYIAFVGILGVLGNLIVIYIFSTTRSLRTPPNMFIINLAFSDMAFSAVNGFPLMTIASFQKKWMWGKLACTLYGYLGGVFGMNSINTLAWISIDRYYVISKPFHAMKNVTHKRAALQLLVVWMWSILWVSPPLLGWGSYIPEGFQIECTFDYISRDWPTLIHCHGMFWFGFITPVFIIAYCYINIILTVSAQGKEMSKTAEKMGAKTTKDDRTKKQELQTAKVAACTISLFLMSWVPYAIVAQLAVYKQLAFITPYTTQIPVMFAKASAMWNPIVYALSHPRFRAQLDERMPWLVCCSGRNMDRDSDSTQKTNKAGGAKKNTRLEHTSSVMSTMSNLASESSESETERDTKVHNTPTPNKKPEQKKSSPPPRPPPPQLNSNSGATHERKSPDSKTPETPIQTVTGSIDQTESASGDKNNHGSSQRQRARVSLKSLRSLGSQQSLKDVTTRYRGVLDSTRKWSRSLSDRSNNGEVVLKASGDLSRQNSEANPKREDSTDTHISLKRIQNNTQYKPTSGDRQDSKIQGASFDGEGSVIQTTNIDDVSVTTDDVTNHNSQDVASDIGNTTKKVVTRQGSEYLPDFV